MASSSRPFSLLTRPLNQATVHGAAPAACARRSACDRVVEPAFLVIHARQVQRPFGPAQPLHFEEGGLGLPQLALFAAGVAFEQQADAVVVPALATPAMGDAGFAASGASPFRAQRRIVVTRARRAIGSFGTARPCRRQQTCIVRSNLRYCSRTSKRRSARSTSLRHLERVVDDLRRPGRNLVVVERDEDVLRVAAVDAVAVAVEHVDVDEVRPRDRRRCRRGSQPPLRPITRSPAAGTSSRPRSRSNRRCPA